VRLSHAWEHPRRRRVSLLAEFITRLIDRSIEQLSVTMTILTDTRLYKRRAETSDVNVALT